MKENITISETDLVKVYQLHSRLERRHIMILIAIWFCAAIYILLMQDYPVYLILFTIAGGLGGMASYYNIYLKYKAKKIFKQQKNLHNDFEYEITDKALKSTSKLGSGETPWSDFHRIKENSDYLLLYFSDALFMFFPKFKMSNEFIKELKINVNS